jgi:hypothetical protein
VVEVDGVPQRSPVVTGGQELAMDPILGPFLALMAALKPAAGATLEDLAALRRFVAAILFQQNPGSAIPNDPALDPALAAALAEGAALAATWAVDGTRARFVQVLELTPTASPEQPSHQFGPFLEPSGNLLRFLIFERARFQAVHIRLPNGNPSPESVLLLPPLLVPQEGNRTFDIPAGTVWMLARFLTPGARGRVGLRVTRGRLTVSAPATGANTGRMLLPSGAQWTLALEPEPPPPAEATGFDANGITLTLPQLLEVRSNGAPLVTGAPTLVGFGSMLTFVDPGGAPINTGVSIDFPFDAAATVWDIAGNRSAAAQLTGTAEATSAVWSLPVNSGAPSTFSEAPHGGSLVVQLRGALALRLAGVTGGSFRCEAALLTANAHRLDLEARRPAASGRLELELWRPALSRVVFGPEPAGRLRFVSERDRGDLALVHEGGAIRNRWDLPLAAAGEPFGFAGPLENIAVLAHPLGLALTCVAHQEQGDHAEGLALENLYLTVQRPNRLTLYAAYDGAAAAPDGVAVLLFDVLLAQPTLPDPYAASWSLPDGVQAERSALALSLSWAGATTPAMATRLMRPVAFPEPRDLRRDNDSRLRERFNEHLAAQTEVLSLLDLSSNDQHFGVALESLSDQEPTLADNRLTLPLRSVRLLMEPQVLWEPVQAGSVELSSTLNGGRTLLGTNTVKLVPVLPGVIAAAWVDAAQQRRECAALFSLPFGLRAFARLDGGRLRPLAFPPIEASLHQVDFGPAMTSAQQVRLTATGNRPPGRRDDPARSMPGALHQLDNLRAPNAANLRHVLDDPLDPIDVHMEAFNELLPLHQADLSGYGLSTFSDWRRDAEVGVTQVRFDVMRGRTALEVIQRRTVLAPCEAHLVRTIVMERRNSGRVLRFDSGWLAVDDGLFAQPARFDRGVVIAFRHIRRIRVLDRPVLVLSDGSVWREVLYDCDAELEHVTANGVAGHVPVRDQSGYVQVAPSGPGAAPTAARIAALFAAVSGPIGGPADCAIRIGGTLEAQVARIAADVAPRDGNQPPGFVVAAYVSPKLPRAGQWSAVRITSATGEAAPVDPRHGIPVVRRAGQPYTFLEPAEAYRANPVTGYGLLMATAASRVLFPQPTVDPGEPGVLRTAAPLAADPLALAQSTGAFPRRTYALRCAQPGQFDISAANDWRLANPDFAVTPPAADLAQGAAWAIQRAFPPLPKLSSVIDSASEAAPWDIGVTPNDLKLDIPPFGTLFTITTNYSAVSGALPKLQKPSLEFGPFLDGVKALVNALTQFVNLGFDVDVDVDAGTGPSPSFIVRITLRFRIGEGPNERIDIGIGKFYGEFQIHGQLEASLSGATRGRLLVEFQGDIQQPILPPLVYAGGMFRFALEIRESGPPLLELGLGVTTSLGGDLIKGLLEVEVTITYGYMLIPETLQPGVLLGLEARAKLLGGLIGFSFAVQAMARIQRVALEDLNVTIFADIRVVATVQIAWLLEEDIDIRTQFKQKLPLGLAALPLGGGALAVVGSI